MITGNSYVFKTVLIWVLSTTIWWTLIAQRIIDISLSQLLNIPVRNLFDLRVWRKITGSTLYHYKKPRSFLNVNTGSAHVIQIYHFWLPSNATQFSPSRRTYSTSQHCGIPRIANFTSYRSIRSLFTGRTELTRKNGLLKSNWSIVENS